MVKHIFPHYPYRVSMNLKLYTSENPRDKSTVMIVLRAQQKQAFYYRVMLYTISYWPCEGRGR